MDSVPSTRDLTCRLERPDGSVWRVTAVDLDDAPPTVTALRDNPFGGVDPDLDRLRDEPLRHGDRLEWRDRSGAVVWAMRSPLDAVERSTEVGSDGLDGR